MMPRVFNLRMTVASLLLVCACGGDDEIGTTTTRGAKAASAGSPPPQGAAAQAGATAGSNAPDVGPNTFQYDVDEFIESERSRDPFQPFTAMFKPKPQIDQQRSVKISDTSIEEMKLIAIISGNAKPRAMLLDKMGVGHTVERGDYVGRPEVVQDVGASGEPVSFTLNWRVDRIRSGEVVLSREDPTTPGDAPLIRSLPLFSDTSPSKLQAIR